MTQGGPLRTPAYDIAFAFTGRWHVVMPPYEGFPVHCVGRGDLTPPHEITAPVEGRRIVTPVCGLIRNDRGKTNHAAACGHAALQRVSLHIACSGVQESLTTESLTKDNDYE